MFYKKFWMLILLHIFSIVFAKSFTKILMEYIEENNKSTDISKKFPKMR